MIRISANYHGVASGAFVLNALNISVKQLFLLLIMSHIKYSIT